MLARKGVLAVKASLGWLLAGAVAAALAAAPARAQGEKVLRAGYAIEAPYAFLGDDGRVTGEAPEIARRIAGRLGFSRIDWVQTRFEALIPELKERRFDIVAAGLFITPERARQVAFSRPTLRARQALLVRAGNPLALHSYEDVVAKQARIAVIEGAVEQALLRRLGVPEERLVATPDALVGRAALESGLADGLALSSPTVRWMARRDSLGRTESAAPFRETAPPAGPRLGYAAFAFRLEDRALAKAWDGALAAFIGGAEHRSLASSFGLTGEEIPEPLAAADILKE